MVTAPVHLGSVATMPLRPTKPRSRAARCPELQPPPGSSTGSRSGTIVKVRACARSKLTSMRNLAIVALSTTLMLPIACGESSDAKPDDATPSGAGEAGAGAGAGPGAGLGGAGGEIGPAPCSSGDCGGSAGAGGQAEAAAGAGGQGGQTSGTSCGVVVLVQNSGAMFELPAALDPYFYWVREALSTSVAAESLLQRAELGISFFMKAEELPECPDLRHHTISALPQIESAFDTTVNETGGVNKSDAPLAEAVENAASVLADAGATEAHLVLVITGSP